MDGDAHRTAAPDAGMNAWRGKLDNRNPENRLRRVAATFQMSRMRHRYRPAAPARNPLLSSTLSPFTRTP
jgi:hypothetical protein